MTEAEWNRCTSPRTMLELLRGSNPSARKLRLFAVACCRRVWPFLTNAHLRNAVEQAESFADGVVPLRVFVGACEQASHVASDPAYRVAPPYSTVSAIEHARIAACLTAAHPQNDMIRMTQGAAGHASTAASVIDWDGNHHTWPDQLRARRAVEDGEQACMLRDIFGSPFRHIVFDRGWLRPMAHALAEAVYEDRAFDRLPILADALEEASCNSGDILAHLRAPEPHTRGCWALDLVTGRG